MLLGMPEVTKDLKRGARLIDEIHQIEGKDGVRWRWCQARLWLSDPQWRTKRREITEQLGACVRADAGWPEAAVSLARLHEQAGEAKEAEAVCRRALAANPSSSVILDHLVALLEGQGHLSEAKQALDDFESNGGALRAQRYQLAMGERNYEQAIGELKQMVEQAGQGTGSGGNPAPLAELARLTYLEKKDAKAALAYLDQAEKIAPDAVRITDIRAWVLRGEKRFSDARKVLDERVEMETKGGDPDRIFTARHLRAAYFESLGRLKDATDDERKQHLGEAEAEYKGLATFKGNGGKGAMLLSTFYAGTGREDDAIDALRSGLKADPNSVDMRRTLMARLFDRGQIGDREKAVVLLGDIEGRDRDHPDLLYARAMVERDKQTEEGARKAEELLRRVVELEPTADRAHLALIDTAAWRAARRTPPDFRAARDIAIGALSRNPESISLLLARADIERRMRNLAVAADLVRSALKDAPTNASALNFLAQITVESKGVGGLSEVRTLVEQAIQKDAASDRLQVIEARLLTTMKQRKAAISRLDEFCKTDAGLRSVPGLLVLADLCRAEGDLTKAGAYLDRAEALSPKSPAVLGERINWLGAQDKPEKYDQTVKLISDYRATKEEAPDVLMVGASLLASSSLPQHRREARMLYEHVMAKWPGLSEPCYGLGWMAFQENKADEAVTYYRKALKVNPNEPRALNDLAWILAVNRHEYKEALELANRGVEIDPENRHLRDTRGVIYCDLKEFAKARQDFEKCEKLAAKDSPELAKALRHAGEACWQLKELGTAKEKLGQALAIDSSKSVFRPEERTEIQKLMELCRTEKP
jgi:tetratricopeptide (TPR) repeat protein